MPVCDVCHREGRGYGWFNPAGPKRDKRVWHACSMAHLDIIPRKWFKMIDASRAERAAMEAASQPAGEYLDSLGKTDLARLSKDEWFTLLDVVCTAYVGALGGSRALGGTELTPADEALL